MFDTKNKEFSIKDLFLWVRSGILPPTEIDVSATHLNIQHPSTHNPFGDIWLLKQFLVTLSVQCRTRVVCPWWQCDQWPVCVGQCSDNTYHLTPIWYGPGSHCHNVSQFTDYLTAQTCSTNLSPFISNDNVNVGHITVLECYNKMRSDTKTNCGPRAFGKY